MADENAARKQAIAGLFSRAAETYDRIGQRYFSDFGARLVELAAVPAGSNVLDIACGRGAVLFPAAARIGQGGRVTGIDFSEGMAGRLGKDIVAQRITNASVLQMDAERPGFPAATFDAILIGFALFFLPEPRRALAEYYRILKPGGVFATSTWGLRDERWDWLAEVSKRHMPPEPEIPVRPDTPTFHTAEGMSEYLERAGFHGVEVLVEEREYTYASPEEWLAAQWSHGSRRWLEQVPPDRFDAYRDDAFAELEKMRRPGGIPFLQRVLFSTARK